MADTERTLDDAKSQLFDHLDELPAGMLGVEGSHQHMQPMKPYFDRDTATVYFLTSRDTDLVKAVGQGGSAHFCIVGKKHDYYACMRGTIIEDKDEKRIDKIWSAMASAWFEGGREAPDLTLLKLKLRDASIWSTTDSSFAFGMEIAKAVLQKEKTPDVGEHVIVQFNAAA